MTNTRTIDGVIRSRLEFDKFCGRAPGPQNAIDLFQSRWASDLSEVIAGAKSGAARLFVEDERPRFLLKHFGNALGNLEGRRILELGPLEGAHTYQLERLGAAEIVAVEANAEAYLKCLVVKELVGLERARFLYGDFIEFLRGKPRGFDVIFCSGVLYHMEDPLALIELMANSADRTFVWTHYWVDGEAKREAVPVERWGTGFTYHRARYQGQDAGAFWGGNAESSVWLSREDILRAFRAVGLVNIDVHAEHAEHPHGPCFSFSAWRDDADVC